MIKALFAILFFIASTAVAQQNSLLWKISGNGLRQPSYVYGTVHSFDDRAFTFQKLTSKYLKDVEAFGMEIKLDEVNPFALLGQLMMPGDTTLSMLLSPEDYKQVETLMRDSFSFELSMFSTIKPMFLVGFLEMPGGETGSDNANFLDEDLMKRAQKLHKEVIGIETVAEQLHAVDLIPLKEQAKMLADELLHPDSTHGDNVKDLLDLYESGNLDSLYSYYKQGELSNTFNKALILDRNHRMADRIDSIAHRKSIFVAVGALHLPGDEGVLNLLKNKGYFVEAIR